MRMMIDLAFVVTATLAASAHAFADPAATDSKLSAECRAMVDLAAAAARNKSFYDLLLKNMEDQVRLDPRGTGENAYFDRFDADKTITLAGTVKEFQWTNPHAKTVLTVTNNDGKADQWAIEMNGAAGLARLGWRPKTLNPGMQITVTIHPLRDGSNGGHLLAAVLPDGKQMPGGRDRPGLLQQLRDQAAAADAAAAELLKKQELLGCGR